MNTEQNSNKSEKALRIGSVSNMLKLRNMILSAKKYKRLINTYAQDKGKEKNTHIYTYARGVYSARIFGLCIIRDMKLFKKLVE